MICIKGMRMENEEPCIFGAVFHTHPFLQCSPACWPLLHLHFLPILAAVVRSLSGLILQKLPCTRLPQGLPSRTSCIQADLLDDINFSLADAPESYGVKMVGYLPIPTCGFVGTPPPPSAPNADAAN